MCERGQKCAKEPPPSLLLSKTSLPPVPSPLPCLSSHLKHTVVFRGYTDIHTETYIDTLGHTWLLGGWRDII